MAEAAQRVTFADGAGYEKFMGQWSRVAGSVFLDWLALPAGLKLLDVGCGTGAFSETIHKRCSPSELVAIDPAGTQVAYAQLRYASLGIDFQVVDALSLPFDSGRFDAAVSALVLNFIPDRQKAVAEMNRVTRPGGTVAAYVWDLAGKRGGRQHLNVALAKVTGRTAGAELDPDSTTLENLARLFESVGLSDVETRPIDIQITYPDFDDCWNSNMAFASPGKMAFDALTEAQQQQVKQIVKDTLPTDDQDRISYSARVNAVRSRA